MLNGGWVAGQVCTVEEPHTCGINSFSFSMALCSFSFCCFSMCFATWKGKYVARDLNTLFPTGTLAERLYNALG